jgi:FkbM family methyltransferase
MAKMSEEDYKLIPVPPGFQHRYEDRSVTVEVFVTKAYHKVSVDAKPDDILLDLGAHIGCVSRYALDHGMPKVVAVEMLPDNIPLLRHNTESVYPDQVKVIHAAVAKTNGTVTALMAKGTGNPMGAYANGSKRQVPPEKMERYHHWEVPAMTMATLLGEHKPTVLKFDIESSEYLVIDPVMLRDAGIHTVVGEYHIQLPDLLEKAHKLYAEFESCGYTMSKPRPEKTTGWGPVITSKLQNAS